MNKITVLMIGCGGTGSWITQPALQILAKSSLYGLKTSMVLIDADEV